MAESKHITAVCIGIIFLTLLITILFMFGKNLGLKTSNNQEEEISDGDWEVSGAENINLSDLGSLPKDGGAVLNNGDLMIISGGKYLLSGKLDNGHILIDAGKEDQIQLFLDNASINSGENASIEIEKALSVILTTKEGSQSNFSSNLNGEDKDIDGVIYSKTDLTVNGKGSINIDAPNSHGIVCNDNLVLNDSQISVNSGLDAIHVNDSIEVNESILNLEAVDDAITVKNDDNNGTFLINSGSINIPSCSEGIEASQIEVNGGKIDISMKDDGFNAVGESPMITINNGEINITCETGQDSDGLDSNGSIVLNGGNIFINIGGQGMNSAIDVATETGGNCLINGATLTAFGGQGTETSLISESQGIIMERSSGSANSSVVLKSNDSNILEKKVPYNFSNVIISSPELKISQNYELSINDQVYEVEAQSEVSSGGMMGGPRSESFGMNNTENSADLQKEIENQDNTNEQPSVGMNGQTPPEKPDDFSEGEQMDETMPEPPDGFTGEPPESSDNMIGEIPGQTDSVEQSEFGNRNFATQGNESTFQSTNQNYILMLELIGISILVLVFAFGISFLVKGKYS